MSRYVYASGKRYPVGMDEERERDADWLEERGLEKSRQRVYEFDGELTAAFYGTVAEPPKVNGTGYKTFVIYPDYVTVEDVPSGAGHKSEEDIRFAWRDMELFMDRYNRNNRDDCGNDTMNKLMDGMADLSPLALSTALAYAALNLRLYDSAVPLLLDMGADPNAVVFVQGEGYTTPLIQAVNCLYRSRNHVVSSRILHNPDGGMYSGIASCGSTVDIMLKAGGDPLKAVLCPDIGNIGLHSLTTPSAYKRTARKMVSVLECLCNLATTGSSAANCTPATSVQHSRLVYILSAVIDRIAGTDRRFLEFMHCGAFSGGLAMDRIPKYYPGELGTRMFAGGDAIMTSYASMIGLVPRTADIYGPGCYGMVPSPCEVPNCQDDHTALSDKAVALFNAGLPFEWDGRWGMDIAVSPSMGPICPSEACRNGDEPELERVPHLGSSLKWMSGRSYPTSQWVDGNAVDTVVAFGANVNGCRTRDSGDGFRRTVCPEDETFVGEAMRRSDWGSSSPPARSPEYTAKALLDMGADPNVKAGDNGDTPVMELARAFANRYSTCDTRKAMLDMLRDLLLYGADVNATNDNGNDALRILVTETTSSLWGDMFSEKGRAQQLIEFARELIGAGLDLNRTFTVSAGGKTLSGLPHEHGLDHALSQFISTARDRLNGIDAAIQANRKKLEAKAATDSKP